MDIEAFIVIADNTLCKEVRVSADDASVKRVYHIGIAREVILPCERFDACGTFVSRLRRSTRVHFSNAGHLFHMR